MEPDAKNLPPNPPSIHNNVFRAEVHNAQRDRTETDANLPSGNGRNVHTIDDYRNPRSRSCWPRLTLQSFNVFSTDGDNAVLCRRICMVTILAIRTVESILSLVFHVHWALATFIIGLIISVLAFFFVAWCLAEIGNMRGQRRLFGKVVVGRWHFDLFLTLMFIAHVLLLVGVLLRMQDAGSATVWILLWLLMFGAAWIATWPPETGSIV